MNRRTVVLLSMTVANAMVLVDQTALPLSLPNIMGDLGVGSQLAQVWAWISPAAIVPLAASLAAAGAFIVVARRSSDRLMSFALLKRHPTYFGATVSQLIARGRPPLIPPECRRPPSSSAARSESPASTSPFTPVTSIAW